MRCRSSRKTTGAAVAKARQWLGTCTDPEAQLEVTLNDEARAGAWSLYAEKTQPAGDQPRSLEARAEARAAALAAFWSAARGQSAGGGVLFRSPRGPPCIHTRIIRLTQGFKLR